MPRQPRALPQDALKSAITVRRRICSSPGCSARREASRRQARTSPAARISVNLTTELAGKAIDQACPEAGPRGGSLDGRFVHLGLIDIARSRRSNQSLPYSNRSLEHPQGPPWKLKIAGQRPTFKSQTRYHVFSAHAVCADRGRANPRKVHKIM